MRMTGILETEKPALLPASLSKQWAHTFLSFFITVVLLRETSLSLLELPRRSATRIIMNTAPPAIQTHGWEYHSVVVVVVVVSVVIVVDPPVLSCAHAATVSMLDIRSMTALNIPIKLIFFIAVFF